MSLRPIEYILARQQGAWAVLREGVPTASRSAFLDAVELATHLAEREASQGSRDARVVMDRQAMLALSAVVAYG